MPGILIWPAAAWETAAGICLVLGIYPRLIALGLAGWCLLTASIFHRAWGDPVQFMHFFKNVTMAGAFFMLATMGMTGWSVMRPRIVSND